MTAQEKIYKSLELLKKLSYHNNDSETIKKEKIQNCHILTESMSSTVIQTASDFPILLSYTMENFFLLCDDPESDVRMVVEECINKIIKALNNENISKLLIECHKEIKRNNSARSLRAALSRFSKLSHYIRPLKGRIYVVNLFPSLIEIIVKRTEDSVHETLSNSLSEIIKILGPFATDNDIKNLLNSCMSIISNKSTVIKRTTANSILNICLDCRKPYLMIVHCINVVLGLMFPLDGTGDNHLILGVMGVLKTLLPSWQKCARERSNKQGIEHFFNEWEDLKIEKLLQIYELCIYYNFHEDHNIVILSLETLNILLQNWTKELKEYLLNPSEITKTQLLVANTKFIESNSKSTTIQPIIFKNINTKNTTPKSTRELENCRGKCDHNSKLTKINVMYENFKKEIASSDFNEQNIPLNFCTRLIVKSFLLSGIPGHLIDDKLCRISVKSSALTCLSTIIKVHPRIFEDYIGRTITDSSQQVEQLISDIILYSYHNDPQLRGNIRTLIANYIVSIIVECFKQKKELIEVNLNYANNINLNIEMFSQIFLDGLKDESFSCVRQTLQSLELCLGYILESGKGSKILSILSILPELANNPYWLVKVSLCNLVCTLPYITILHVSGKHDFQNRVLNDIIYKLLKDSDGRVRRAACAGLLKIIPQLHFQDFSCNSTITSKAILCRNRLLSNLRNKSWINCINFPNIDTIPFPYGEMEESTSENVEIALSKVISNIHKILITTNCKHTLFGCIQTLASLSKTYPCTVYKKAWCCTRKSDVTNDLLKLCVSILENSVLIYEIEYHINSLILSSNLYAGYSISNLKPSQENESNKKWGIFESTIHADLSNNFLTHLIRILCIYQHIVDDVLVSSSHSKSIILNLPAASPMKKRKSDLEKKNISSTKLIEEKNEKKERDNIAIGAFASIPHYLKIHEILKTAYENYKATLESSASEKFLSLLRESLKSLSILMEIGSLSEFGVIAEEILNYLKSIFRIEPTATVECVQQLLKSIFGTNLLTSVIDKELHKIEEVTSENKGFYYEILMKPINVVTKSVEYLKYINNLEYDENNTIRWPHGNIKAKVTFQRNLDKVLANYIKIFEPMVIKSLKHYTITSDVHFQRKVLVLLTQLLQLRINYCLLDADQIFIAFVINQLEYIEAGQIQHSKELIPKIFQFLVHLSYSNQHTKSIIDIPKILRLCDGLSASGQCPLSHCIPSLKPIVEDIFLTRNIYNSSNVKELETTREVILSMLMKLIQYHEIVELIILILDDSRCSYDSQKWLRLSQKVLTFFLPVLKEHKYELDTAVSFNTLKKLIFALNPIAFRPIDDIILILFQEPPRLGHDFSCFTRWLGKIITVFIILSSVQEDIIISRISFLKNNFVPNSVFENVVVTPDPLNVTNSADFFQHLSSEIILIRFIFRTLTLATKKCTLIVYEEEKTFFFEELSVFMILCFHNFQSGFLCKTSNVAKSIIEKSKYAEECDAINLDPIIEDFKSLRFFYPVLTIQWCYFLTLLSYGDGNFWLSTLHISETYDNKSLITDVINTGVTVVFCNYLCENFTKEIDNVCWLLKNNLNLLINLDEEAPVKKFFLCIQKDFKLNQLLLDNIEEQSINCKDSVFILKLLQRIENSNPNTIGKVIKLLIKMMNINDIILIKPILKLTTSKLELILNMPVDFVHNQLSKEEMAQIFLNRKEYYTKHEALLGLLNKLYSKFYKEENQNNSLSIVDTNSIKNLVIDEEWFRNQIISILNQSKIGNEIAELLSVLNYEEQFQAMQGENFNMLILKDCLEYGFDILRSGKVEHVPDILKAATERLFVEMQNIVRFFDEASEVQNILDKKYSTDSISKNNLFVYFNSQNSFVSFRSLIPSVLCYLECFPHNPLTLEKSDSEVLLKYNLLLLEYANDLIAHEDLLDIHILHIIVKCVDHVLQLESNLLNMDSYSSLANSAVNNIYNITIYFLKSLEQTEISLSNLNKKIINNHEKHSISSACIQLYSLFDWLYKRKRSGVDIPVLLINNLDNIIISLGRLAIFKTYMLIPLKVWNKNIGSNSTLLQNPVTPLPVEMLHEVEMLQEYIFKTNLLGWDSKQTFEETWMCLLSILCISPSDEVTPDELNEIYNSVSLGVKGISSMLIQTLYYPIPGKKNISKLIHIPRNESIVCDKTSFKKLKDIQFLINNKRRKYFFDKNVELNIFCNDMNLEKKDDTYSFSQMSIKYSLIAVGLLENVDQDCFAYKTWTKRNEILQKNGLDVTSCLHFLKDFSTQFMQLQQINSLALYEELLKSILLLSDLFNDKSQFNWMLDLFLDILKVHSIGEELIHQYLIIGICKATAVLNPELKIFETVKNYLLQFLKCSYLPSRVASLHGLLFIIEGCILNNFSIGGISENMQMILPCVVDYVQINLNTLESNFYQSEEHTLLVWSIAFYIIENVDEVHLKLNFIEAILTNAISELSSLHLNKKVFFCILKGLQRIIVSNDNVSKRFGKKVVELSLDRLKNENPFITISSFELLLTQMYIGCIDQFKSHDNETNPEDLVLTIEKFSALFEYMKNGSHFEVEIICSLLPKIIEDFFTPADILTKIICEFLSTRQSNQKHLSRVIFHLFQSALRQDQLILLQDWIVCSLPNFTQNFSYPMATWCLTCFFVSASCNKWLTSLFPYIQTRIQRYEYEDRKMLCIAGLDFYRSLSNDTQKKTFLDHFEKVRDLPEMPFNELLSSL